MINNNLFKEMFEKHSLVMLIICPISGVILAANVAAQNFYGYSNEELLKLKISDLNILNSEDIQHEMEKAKFEKRNYFVFQHRLKNGEIKFVEVHSSPVNTNDGTVLFSAIHDITEKLKSEELLKVRDLAIEATSMGMFVTDRTGIVQTINDGFTKITGMLPEDIVGKRCQILHGTLTNQQTEALIQQCQANKVDYFGEILNYKKDGTPFWNELRISPVFNDKGELSHFVGIVLDVTNRKKIEQQLTLSANVFKYAREGIVITDVHGNIIDVNNAFCTTTGYSLEEVKGKNPRIFNSGKHDKTFFLNLWNKLLSTGNWTGEIWNKKKNGEYFAIMQNISAVYNSENQIENFVALFSDITELKNHELQLEHIAHYDALTGLANRVVLAKTITESMTNSLESNIPLYVVFFDLDGFKEINDKYGHDVGDELLIAISNRMKSVLPDGDLLARIGGDEFVALLKHIKDVDSLYNILETFLNTVSNAITIEEHIMNVSCSIGVSIFPQDNNIDADQLVRQADQAMYQAKLEGKNRFCIFDSKSDLITRHKNELLDQIHYAIEKDEFVLFYQPKVNMRIGKIDGFEALIRWQHPYRGLIGPFEFLPAIEDNPLSIKLGQWVIENALKQLSIWKKEGIYTRVSVNISGLHIQTDSFTTQLNMLFSRYPDVSPSQLEIELLETSALEDFEKVLNVVESCKKLGVTFALDDFGTGYSSLSYLKKFPVKRLKIDQSFVKGMLVNEDDEAILKAVIGLSSSLKREVVAEGVETTEQGLKLIQLGCNSAQGYAIAKPMRAELVAPWIQSWHPDRSWIA